MSPIQRSEHWELHRAEDRAYAAEAERNRYREALEMIAQHDWQDVGAKGASYTLRALAEFVDIARAALAREGEG